MPLLSFFASNPDAVAQLTIEQIVSNAGDGSLKDHSICCQELREYLGQIPTSTIGNYIDHCLENSFQHSGMVLQDLVNELGRRLDYDVENGRYQGVTSGIGFDGLWKSPEDHSLIIEVKTTDAYRLSLDTLSGYRQKLLQADRLAPTSSILIVVGRRDTGELEAQIRGSRHAWDVRVISAEALIKLVTIKENSEATETGLKIRSVLTPFEYTRLDRMVDVMFTAVSDFDDTIANEEMPSDSSIPMDDSDSKVPKNSEKGVWQFTDSNLLQAKRDAIIARVSKEKNSPLVRKSRALYWNATRNLRVACSISKRYMGKNRNPYWYAYHPSWDDFLGQEKFSYFVLGCMDKDVAFSIPQSTIKDILPYLNTTTGKDGKTYWHIVLKETQAGLEIILPKSDKNLALNSFQFNIL